MWTNKVDDLTVGLNIHIVDFFNFFFCLLARILHEMERNQSVMV